MTSGRGRVGLGQGDGAPYRDPPPPCAKCAARAGAACKMEPFSKDHVCPACLHNLVSRWSKVCRGERRFRIKEATVGTWWFFFWRRGVVPAVAIDCLLKGPVPVPAHFHFECASCEHRWLMRAAREDL